MTRVEMLREQGTSHVATFLSRVPMLFSDPSRPSPGAREDGGASLFGSARVRLSSLAGARLEGGTSTSMQGLPKDTPTLKYRRPGAARATA